MKTFNSAAKGYNRQYAAAYAVYMIAGSYFSSTKSAYRLKNLYLHYAEMPRSRQYDCENYVINSMEKLGRSFLRKISSLHCEVTCRNCGEELFLIFDTGFEGIFCKIHKNGRFEIAPARACEKAA